MLFVFLVLLLANEINAQGLKMGNPWVGRTNVSRNFGDDHLIFQRQAELNLRSYDWENALFQMNNAVANNPNSPTALLHRARVLTMLGMEAEAAADIRLANRYNPYAADLLGFNPPVKRMQILAYEPATAMAALNTTQRLDYYYADIDHIYADIDADVNELTLIEEVIEAIEFENYTAALELTNTSLRSFSNSAITHDLQGVILLKQGQLAAAETAFQRAIELRPDFAIAWYNLGRVTEQLGKRAAALKYFDQALELENDLTKAYFDRALLHKKSGNPAAAIEDYDKVLALRGDAYLEAYINRGLARKTLGDYAGALADLNKAIEEFPQRATLYNHRGNLHLLFGYHNRALEDYTQAIQLDNNYAEAYYNRGLTHFVVYDEVSGCFDLEKSETLGYERAGEKRKYFCVQ